MHDSEPTFRPRYPAIDVLRGVALLAMVLYHLSWDLSYHGLVLWEVVRDPLWRGFAVSIATSFLVLSGVSLALGAEPAVDIQRYLARLLRIGAGAAAVSLGTFLVAPDAWVFFGILHLMAAGSVLVLPLLRAPVLLTLALALAAFLLPAYARTGVFDQPFLWWLGLSKTVPVSNDYVPVFPWIAAMLVGVAAGRLVARGTFRLPTRSPRNAAVRGLATAGRWSLVVYLVHQPLLFGLTAGLAAVLPPDRDHEIARFAQACIHECEATSGDAPACRQFCGCVADALVDTTFFDVRGGDPAMGSLVATAAMSCRAGETPMPGEPAEEE